MTPGGTRRLSFGVTAVTVALGLVGCSSSAPRTQPVLTSPAPTAGSTAASTVPPPVTTTTEACSTVARLASWSIARLAAQTIVVPVAETDVAAVVPDVAGGAGGVILFGSSAPADLARAIAGLRASAPGGIPPLVMTDEEGGSVQRMANLVGEIPSAREMSATMTPAQIQQVARALALRLRANGITMDLAPVLDIDGGNGPDNRDPDGTRSFSASPAIASADGRAFAAGLEAGSVIPVAKHFPGLGGATGNTDVTPAATPPWAELQRAGLVPFADAVASRVPAIMVSNATVPGLSALPASISPAVVTGVLRDRLGYRGLVLTDSLSAAALADTGYPVARAAAAALEAGADMILYSPISTTAGTHAIASGVIAAVVAAARNGALPRAQLTSAVAHVLTAKGIDLCAAQ